MPSTIRIGSKGAEVKRCQELLTKHGFVTTADGDFGPGTEKSVISFQSVHGLGSDGVVGRKTWAALMGEPVVDDFPSGEDVLAHARSLGLATWTTPGRLWLFGVRSSNRSANAFDDTMGCIRFDGAGSLQMFRWAATTDPGTYWLEHPLNSSGCAILVEGQYLDTWKIDKHAGKYEALCQRAGKVKVYRDPSRDSKHDLDRSTIIEGYYGINLHAATRKKGGVSTRVDKWSAGCQVHATEAGFTEMMKLAHEQVSAIGLDTFSYTLMDKWW